MPVKQESASVARNERKAFSPAGRTVRVVLMLAFPALGIVGAFGISPKSSLNEIVPIQSVTEDVALKPTSLDSVGRYDTYWLEDIVQRGDTVSSILSRLRVNDADAQRLLLRSASKRSSFRLTPGRSVGVRIGSNGQLLEFVHRGDPNAVRFERTAGDEFEFSEKSLDLARRVEVRSGVVQSSLFGATDQAGIPDSIASTFADIFSNEIDLHRDIRAGDRFSVVYEMLYADNEPIRTGRVLAAEFTVQGKHLQAIYFERPGGSGDYFTPTGKNYKTSFLRSPIEFSRITSGFASARLHPVLQVWRAHKGIDFGAPTGTRVKATGDGTVAFSGWKQGYGKTIVLQHAKGYTTLYGHLSGFAKETSAGASVSQGDVIGFVGMTGLATGPHLHYEFHINGVHVDPTRYALQPGQDISPSYRDAFLSVTRARLSQLELIRQFSVASTD